MDSRVESSLRKWIDDGGDLAKMTRWASRQPIKSAAEADALAAALRTVRADPGRRGVGKSYTTLATLTDFCANVASDDARRVVMRDGLPILRTFLLDALEGRDAVSDDAVLAARTLARFHQREDVELIAAAARKPVAPESVAWISVLDEFAEGHPHCAALVEAMRDAIPTGFAGIAFLDLVNGRAIAGGLDRHPFDTEAGRAHLEAWMLAVKPTGFARSAAEALSFLEPASRERLLRLADEHRDVLVRVEAAWARAKSGDPSGVDRLAAFAADARSGSLARRRLEKLGRLDAVPAATTTPEFQAMLEMADWLADAQQFGRPPDSLELFDSRTLFWPPTDDVRRLFLVKYRFDETADYTATEELGLVGSVTFSLRGEATADLTPEDAYALYCVRELELSSDESTADESAVTADRELLARRNEGF